LFPLNFLTELKLAICLASGQGFKVNDQNHSIRKTEFGLKGPIQKGSPHLIRKALLGQEGPNDLDRRVAFSQEGPIQSGRPHSDRKVPLGQKGPKHQEGPFLTGRPNLVRAAKYRQKRYCIWLESHIYNTVMLTMYLVIFFKLHVCS
jgi:hypothetical protein